MKTKILLSYLCITFLLVGCSGYQESFIDVQAAKDPGTLIVISDYTFNPQMVIVNKGESITWENRDKDEHTLYYSGIETKPLAQGETFSLPADIQGTYEYSSGNHPFMKGTVIVR